MRYAAFLRAVNVAGNALPMAALKAMLHEDLGFGNVRTYLQSGNVVFESKKRNAAALEDALQRETLDRLGVRTEYFVRTAADLQEILERNPFEREAVDGPSHLIAFILKDAPDQQRVAALRAWIKGPELVQAGTRHLYITYPDGIGDSKLTNVAIERVLEGRGTARNWNTIRKIHAALVEG
ncbi:MAG TPA: DUF1697 domain-containing protein [Candidatus Tumulicola sp.]|jgi:uncharacterized protein (DUF1697 family)